MNDTEVDDELALLQQKYGGRLDIELWDRGRISGMLHEHGALVAGIFGLAWARAWCGYYPIPGPPTPPGSALLNDPIDILELSALRQRAADLAQDAPATAAQLYATLADTLDERGLVGERQRINRGDVQATRGIEHLRRVLDQLDQVALDADALNARIEELLTSAKPPRDGDGRDRP